MMSVDRPIWAALSGPQAGLSTGTDRARAYPADIGPLAATCDDSPEALADLTDLVREREMLILLQAELPPVPAGCRADMIADAVQMVAADLILPADPDEVAVLGDADAPDMLALARLAEPGPFGPRTHTLGRFVGVRVDGRLVAMAGERMRFAGHAEVSGVCTHPDFRGSGLAKRLCAKVIGRIIEQQERPFLHAYAHNTKAIRLYESLGFVVRRSFKVMKLVRAD